MSVWRLRSNTQRLAPVLIVVAPGQGSQTPGMLTPWLNHGAAAEIVERASDVTGIDLKHMGTEADADTIRDTAIAQPLIVAAGLASLAAVQDSLGLPITNSDFVAGHSVGEITALAAAGVISLDAAFELVAVRGRAMAEAAAAVETSMAAVLGGERDEVVTALTARGLIAANENGSKQIVAAGTREAIDELVANAPAGTRVRPLAVAGAFHTHFMASATEAVSAVAANVSTQSAAVRILSNKDGTEVSDSAELLARLVGQVSNPVRWDLCMETMAAESVTGMIELFPGGTLTGIAKRALAGVELLPLTSLEECEKVSEFVSQHRGRVASATTENV